MDWQQLAPRLEAQCKQFCSYDFSGGALPAGMVTADTEDFAFTFQSACEELLDVLRQFKYGRCDAATVVREAADAVQSLRSAIKGFACKDAIFHEQFSAFIELLVAIPTSIDVTIKERRDFYVYAHCDKDGSPFYIGMGWDKSAWSTSRKNPFWHQYVERLKGVYEVAILRSGLSAEDAEEYRDKLIAEHGAQLVNVQGNPHHFDLAAITQYHALRDANMAFVAATKPLETTNPELAATRYKQAIEQMKQYANIEMEKGLVGELSREHSSPDGEPFILDRLTLCLFKLGRFDEVIQGAEEYFAEFPGDHGQKIGERILKRVERARLAKDRGR